MPDSLNIRDEIVPTPTPSLKRKPGRPRKANPQLITILDVPTGALIAETPHESAVGGGQDCTDDQFLRASPHSNQTGGDAVADETGQLPNDSHVEFARSSAPPSQTPPAVAVGGGQHVVDAQASSASPSTDTVAANLDTGDGCEVRARHAVSPIVPLPGLAPIIEEIQSLQRKRLFYMISIMAPRNRTLQWMRTILGWQRDGNEAANKKVLKRAANIVNCVEAMDKEEQALKALEALDDDAPARERSALERKVKEAQAAQEKIKLSGVDELEMIDSKSVIQAEMPSRRAYTELLKITEKEMTVLAKKLPIYMWSEGVRGLGPLGIATIIGETGDLTKDPTTEGVMGYATHERVWKRLGLAVINGRRQGDPGPGATSELWIEHGYRKIRRSQCWKINDSLIRAQWRGAKEDDDTGEITDGYALGPYGELYARQKIEEHRRNDSGEYAEQAAKIVSETRGRRKVPHPENVAGRLTKKHLDNKARRIVEKQLIEDIWREWNRPRQEF